MTMLRCVTVVKDESICVGCRVKCTPANDEYPELIPRIDDECERFIVDPEKKVFWPSRDFFAMHPVTALLVDPKELNPGAPIER